MGKISDQASLGTREATAEVELIFGGVNYRQTVTVLFTGYATEAYANALVVGLWDDRGNFDASVNAYPSSGGSGTAGAILKGDIWTVSVQGVLPTGLTVLPGDTVRALIDTPGNTQANWAIGESNLGYTPIPLTYIDTDVTLAANADDKIASQKATKTYVDALRIFKTVAVSGQSDVVADTAADTLTLAAGSNVTITTNASTDTITIAASASGTNVVDANWFNVKASPYNALGDGSTDDTAAIQAAIDACETYGGGTVYFPKGVYVVNGALQDTSRSNSQLVLPKRDYADTEAITIVFRGEAAPPSVASVIGSTPIPDNLSIIKGTLNTGTNAALIGSHGPVGTFANFTNILFVMRDLVVQMPANPVLTALDLSCVAQIDIDQVIVHAGSFDVASISVQTTSTSFGLRAPGNGNGALVRLGAVNVVGFYNGFQIAEHCVGQMPVAWGCKNAYVFIAADHASAFVRLMAVHCQKVLTATGDHYTTISEMNIEHAASGTWVPVYDIDDSSGYIRGNARWHVVLAVSGVSDILSINGLASFNNGLRLRLERLGKWFQYALTDAASIAVPGYVSTQFRVTLAGNRTLSNPTGLNDGDVFSIRIKQDATGSRTLAYSSMYKFAGGTVPVLTTTANAIDFLTCQYDMNDGTLFCSMIKDVK